ncbi:MAG: adenylyl-sulfate kinase [Gammaproteobacteria bacterium]
MPSSSSTPVVIVSGPVGVGKTTVAEELSEILNEKRTPHTLIDFDQLRYTYPRPLDDPWGNRLAFENLASIWGNCVSAGALNLIVASVVETSDFIDQIEAAIPDAEPVTVQLAAEVGTLHARVRRREIGSGLDWHLNRAAELARILESEDVPCDQRLVTDDLSVRQIAQRIFEIASWRLA